MAIRRVVSPWHGAAESSRFRALGLWGDATISELFDERVAESPDKLAVGDSTVRWTYRQLGDLSRRLAHLLVEWGVGPGDVVAVQVRSCALLPLVHIACNRIGAIWLPMSIAWRGAEVGALLRVTEAKVLIAETRDGDFDLGAMHGSLRPDLPHLERLATVSGSQGEGSLLERIAKEPQLSATTAAALRPHPDEPAHVMVSSGTTSTPKASLWSSNDAVAMTRMITKALRLVPEDIAGALTSAGLGSTGYVFPVMMPLLVGATSILLERWSPEDALAMMARERCTYITAIPTQLTDLLACDLDRFDLGSLTRINNAGAPLSPHAAEQLEVRMHCRVQTVYGATDGGVPVMTAIDDPEIKRRTTVGKIAAGNEVRLTLADGTLAAPGDVGEICWRGPTKSMGYLRQPAYDAAAFTSDGWFRSGDLAKLDAEGYMQIVGRSKDMILRGGMNIFPAELEAFLANCPNVAAVAVVSVLDERLGERVCAVVVPSGAAAPTLTDLTAFLTSREVARFKHPEFLVIVDQLPLNAGGKIDKPRLTEHARAQTKGASASSNPVSRP